MRKDIILCVDDEPIVVRACTQAITGGGFRCLVAENGAAGLDSFIEFKDEICLVLADIIMPTVNGLDMVESILQIDPTVKVLMMSGFSDQVLERQGRNEFPFIRKPFIYRVLIEKIHSLVGAADAAASGT
jgi:DNA-binding NtrC family response regulator